MLSRSTLTNGYWQREPVRLTYATAVIVTCALLLSSCAPSISIYGEPSSVVWGDATTDRSASRLDIPPGHLPPPGQCRIWYPDRPPGHQPPPGDCGELERRIPPDAVLVYG